jgi:hypothetical protein
MRAMSEYDGEVDKTAILITDPIDWNEGEDGEDMERLGAPFEDIQYRDIKFVSTPAKLLVGENTYHSYLLQEEYGTDDFPSDTLAIGRAFVKDNEVSSYSFDFIKNPSGKATALRQLGDYCERMGYLWDAQETFNTMINIEPSQTSVPTL